MSVFFGCTSGNYYYEGKPVNKKEDGVKVKSLRTLRKQVKMRLKER